MSTRREPEDALHSLGWKLDGPRQTAGGWEATIRRGAISILHTGPTAEQVKISSSEVRALTTTAVASA